MKTNVLLLFSCLLCSTAFAKKDYNTLEIKALNMELKKTSGGIFVSQEITNLQYRVFLNDLIAQGRVEEAQRFRPDSLQWRTVDAYCEPLVQHYFTHPAYDNYPIVNITQEGAEAYGQWLAGIVKADAKLNLPNAECGLPSEKDWVNAAGPFIDNPYPWYGPYAYNEKGQMLCNVRVKTIDNSYRSASFEAGSASILTPTEAFYPNKYGLYNIIGNVAELTSEGYIKGGSFMNTFDECAINKRQDFVLPSVNVGFRVALWPNGKAVSQQ